MKNILRKKRFWILFLYVALLGVSYVVRVNREEPPVTPGKGVLDVSIYKGQSARVAFKESGKPDPLRLPVIMIHGSPGSADNFDGLARQLPDRRIISIDLPGFGDSEKDIPDYSIKAHSRYIREFLRQKKIGKAHFVGFSLGGGVILHIAESDPELVESITFLASVGVQEYELFGDYHANRMVHAVQLGFFWLLREATPHFGIFDGNVVPYSRNFFDTDQRPLRELLERTDQPFLILHGKDDPLVPVEAAREHARIVPQSEYLELEDDHFFVFVTPEKISGALGIFWKKVEDGLAITRSTAVEERVASARQPFEYKVLEARGPMVLCFVLLLFVATLLDEDLPAVMSGVFIAQGRFGLLLPVFAVVPALLISVIFWFWLGRRKRNPDTDGPEGVRTFGFRQRLYRHHGRRAKRNAFTGILSLWLGGLAWVACLALASYFLSELLVWMNVVAEANTLVLLAISFVFAIAAREVGFRITQTS